MPDLERRPKPPLGSPPFHIMETTRDFCGLCGMSGQKIVDDAEDFCPVILQANAAASEAWAKALKAKT